MDDTLFDEGLDDLAAVARNATRLAAAALAILGGTLGGTAVLALGLHRAIARSVREANRGH